MACKSKMMSAAVCGQGGLSGSKTKLPLGLQEVLVLAAAVYCGVSHKASANSGGVLGSHCSAHQ
jgi:hypothetical protein